MIYIVDEPVQTNINVYRERWIEHLAFVGGLTFFWVFIVHNILRCFVGYQFTSSLRREADPSLVHRADLDMNGSFVNNIRRKFLSSTPFGMPTSEELQLDSELTEHLSYSNLY